MTCYRLRCALRACALLPLCLLIAVAGCATGDPATPKPKPDVAPQVATQALETLALDASSIAPMYTELLAIDLPTVLRVAGADNLDILSARQTVLASRGRLESVIGSAFPVIVPMAAFQAIEGRQVNTDGRILNVGFNSFSPSVTVQWAINPGAVIYEIIAAKRRVAASRHEEESVILETLRASAVQFYDLVLAQADVAAAGQGVDEAKELLRISQLRQATGTGVKADEMRAEARLAERQQDLIVALDRFYGTSVRLATTLRLNAAVTLIPKLDKLPAIELVREDLSIDALLEIALAFRPDLMNVRTLVEAAVADRGSTWWSGFGPGIDVSYTYGGVLGSTNNVIPNEGIPNNLMLNPASPTGAFSPNPFANGLFREGISRGSTKLAGRSGQTRKLASSQRFASELGWRLSLATFGDLKVADATQRQALYDAQRQMDRVSAQVIAAAQASHAQKELIRLAGRQVAAAEEALRLSELNLQAGAMTTLDVLQAQDAATQARLRHARSVVGYNQAQVNLLASLGLADARTLSGTPNSDDDPDSGEASSEIDAADRAP